MTCFAPSLASCDACRSLSQLIKPDFNADSGGSRIHSLQRMFSDYCSSNQSPCASYGLHVTAEIHYQSEHWLPLDELRLHFYRFYRQALTYVPVLSSTPFADATSWAGIVSRFPPFLHNFANPVILLQQLQTDTELRKKFLFWSFMPDRFYGDGSDRYPEQAATIGKWLQCRNGRVRCLDAACGDGAATYGLARLFLEQGWHPDRFEIEGWTLEPLEVWSAAHGRFPHHLLREAAFRTWVSPVFEKAADRSIMFRCTDLMSMSDASTSHKGERYDLIICNGLLGGPIISRLQDIRHIASNLCSELAPGGMLLVADHFHGGWKKNIPGESLGDVFRACGFSVTVTGEGIVGTRI